MSTLRIALGNIRHRSGKNFLLLLTLFLNVYFLSLVLFAGTSGLATYNNMQKAQNGRESCMIWNTGSIDAESLCTSSAAKEVCTQEALYLLEKADNCVIARATDEWLYVNMPVLLQGRLPEKEGEIALELEVLVRSGIPCEVGTVFTPELAGTDCVSGVTARETHEFTLVGILERKGMKWTEEYYTPIEDDAFARIARGCVRADAEPLEGTQVYRSLLLIGHDTDAVTGWVQLHEGESPMKELRVSYNTVLSDFSLNNDAAIVLCVLLILAITTITVSGIASVLGNDLAQRTSRTGLLRAVGATGRQILRLLLWETGLLACCTLPLGLLAAWGTVCAAAKLLPVQVTIDIPMWCILTDIVFCLACVLVAALLPAKRAMRISPMQAVRDTDRNWNIRRGISRSLTRFLPERLIAKRSNSGAPLRSAGTKTLVGTQTLLVGLLFVISILLLNSIGSNISCSYAISKNDVTYNFYNLEGESPYYSQADVDEIRSMPGIERVSGAQDSTVCVRVQEYDEYIANYGPGSYEYLTGELTPLHKAVDPAYVDFNTEWVENQHREYEAFRDYMGTQDVLLEARLNASDLDMSAFRVLSGKIDTDAMRRGEEILLAIPEQYAVRCLPEESAYWLITSDFSEDDTVFTNTLFHAGDELTFSVLSSGKCLEFENGRPVLPLDLQIRTCTVRIGAIVSLDTSKAFAAGLNWFLNDMLQLYTTNDGFAALGYEPQYREIRVYRQEDSSSAMSDAVAKEIEMVAKRVPNGIFSDYGRQAQEERQVYTLYIAAFVLVGILFFCITFGVCAGTVSGRIRSETQQIGTMRAVGASRRVVTRVYTRQILTHFAVGGGIGCAAMIFILIIFLKNSPWYLSDGNALLCVLAILGYLALLVGLCMLSVKRCLRPILKQSIVENIRIL